ncbi:MAG: ABC transporter permease, partial [Aurantimicrobium sp.]
MSQTTTPVTSTVVLKSWKAPIAFGIFTVVALVIFILLNTGASTNFRLSTESDFIQLPAIDLPALGTGIFVTALLFAMTVLSFFFSNKGKSSPIWMISAFGFFFMVGFLTWAGADGSILVPGLLLGTVGLSIPLIFGALGGIISER